MKERSKKKVILTGVLIVVTLFLFDVAAGPAIISEYMTRDNENLDFSFSRCDDESKSYNDKVISSEWIDDDSINVKGVAVPNCATTWLFGDYEVQGENLILTYDAVVSGLYACVCAHDVEYEISGIERREYKITLKETEGVDWQPYILRMIFSVFY